MVVNVKFCLKTIVGTVTAVVPVYITIQDRICNVTRVEGTSMQPLLNPQNNRGKYKCDYVLLNIWKAKDFNFSRGDIVTFKSPRNPSESLIKRIIGLEGDIIRMKSDRDVTVKIPKGHCWVEGDNSTRSLDSNMFGPISVGLIYSKATRVVWPPSRWQTLEPDDVSCDRIVYTPQVTIDNKL